MDKEFTVLYTHQKQKKAKTWQDGTVKHSGHGNKALLYDEKGARLDSIYIKVQDLTVGEQIESDRYLILIDSLTTSGNTKVIQHVDVAVTKAVTVPQRPQPQARCAGLKKKRSGFVPPRMVKQAICDPVDSSDHNRPTAQADRSPYQPENNVQFYSQIKGVNMSPNISLSRSQHGHEPVMTESSVPNALNKSTDNGKIHQNMFNMYTKFGKNLSCSSSVTSSPVSNPEDGVQVMSPWSVYGSVTSSPSPSQSPSSLSTRHKEEEVKSKHSSGSPVSFVDNVKSLTYTQPDHGKIVERKTLSDCSNINTSILQNDAENVDKVDCDTSLRKQVIPPLKQKRNMNQVMNLLKRKPCVDEVNVRELERNSVTPTNVFDEQEHEVHKASLDTGSNKSKNSDAQSDLHNTLIDDKVLNHKVADTSGTLLHKYEDVSKHASALLKNADTKQDETVSTKYASVGLYSEGFDGNKNNTIDSQTTSSVKSEFENEEQQQHEEDKMEEESVLDNSFGCFDLVLSPPAHPIENDGDIEAVPKTTADKQQGKETNAEESREQLHKSVNDHAQNKTFQFTYKSDNEIHEKTSHNQTTGEKGGEDTSCQDNLNNIALKRMQCPTDVNSDKDTGSSTSTKKIAVHNFCQVCHCDEMMCNCEQHITVAEFERSAAESELGDVLKSQEIDACDDTGASRSKNFNGNVPKHCYNTTVSSQKDILAAINGEYGIGEKSLHLSVESAGYSESSQTNCAVHNTQSNEEITHDQSRNRLFHDMNASNEGEKAFDDCKEPAGIESLKDSSCVNKTPIEESKSEEHVDQTLVFENVAETFCRNKSVKAKKMCEDGDSQTLYMTQDTMEFSCDTVSGCSQVLDESANRCVENKNTLCQAVSGSPVYDVNSGVYGNFADKEYGEYDTNTGSGVSCSFMPVAKELGEDQMTGNRLTPAGYKYQSQQSESEVSELLSLERSMKLKQWQGIEYQEQVHTDDFNECFEEENPLYIPQVSAISTSSHLFGSSRERWQTADTSSARCRSKVTGAPEDLSAAIKMRLHNYEMSAGVRSLPVRNSPCGDITGPAVSHGDHVEREDSYTQYESDFSNSTSPRFGADMEPSLSNQERIKDVGDAQFQFRPRPASLPPQSPNIPQTQARKLQVSRTTPVNNSLGFSQDDEDEVYEKVYRARLMYKNACGGDKLEQLSRSPADLPGNADSAESSQVSGTADSPVFHARNHMNGPNVYDKGELSRVSETADSSGFHARNQMNGPNVYAKGEFNMSHLYNMFNNEREDKIIDSGKYEITDKYVTSFSREKTETVEREIGFDMSPGGGDSVNKENISDNSQSSNFEQDIVGGKTKSSKWEEYIASGASDENDLDIGKFQDTARSAREFSVLEKPAELLAKLAEIKNTTALAQKEMEDKGKVIHVDVNGTNDKEITEIAHEGSSQSHNDCLTVLDGNSQKGVPGSQLSLDFPYSFASADSFDELVRENVDLPTSSEKLTHSRQDLIKDFEHEYEDSTHVYDNVNLDSRNINDNDKTRRSSGNPNDSHLPVSGFESSCDDGVGKIDSSLVADRNSIFSSPLGAMSPSCSVYLKTRETKLSAGVEDQKSVKSVQMEECDVQGDLEESLELSSPEFDRFASDSINSRSLNSSVRVGCRNPTGQVEGKLVNTEESASKTRPNSRCLKLLSKMKLGLSCGTETDDTVDAISVTSKMNMASTAAAAAAVDMNVNHCDKFNSRKTDFSDSQSDRNGVSQIGQKPFCPISDRISASTSGNKVRSVFQPNSREMSEEQIHALAPSLGHPPVEQSSVKRKFKAPAIVKPTEVREQRRSVSAASLSVYTRPDKRVVSSTHTQGVSSTQFHFPCRTLVDQLQNVVRQVVIPEMFPSVSLYRQVLIAAVTEYVNTQLFEVARRYHHALSKVDTSGYTEGSVTSRAAAAATPQCLCGAQSKMVMVKKQGANQGRYFYACSANRNQQCKFFQWVDDNSKGGYSNSSSRRAIKDSKSLSFFMKDNRVHFYGESHLIVRTKENISRYFKAPKWVRARADPEVMQKKQIVLKIPYKGHSSLYAKDDLWIVSKTLDFGAGSTFIAKSTYHGPTAAQEVEIEPVVGYSPSNWPAETVCHAILAGNASSELSCIENIREHLQPTSPPIVTQLLNRNPEDVCDRGKGQYQMPRMVLSNRMDSGCFLPSELMDDLSRDYMEQYQLNADQAEAVRRVACMFSAEKADHLDNILLIHGVFGAGKSFLLSVVVLLLVTVFEEMDKVSTSDTVHWKLLISSTTNVAVDRLLNGLLELGFEDFVRVGSVKKIAKSVLPYSVHATGTDSQELRDLQEMLRSGELTAAEKSNVRKSIEKHRCGENKKKLSKVRVVGATCASCSLTCLHNMQFPLVLLDECSQMTEPTSLLPIARFSCQKLILVGDPKQLAPTIQSVEAAHGQGLEQTMFDRLLKMGHTPSLLRTQYRCHPYISALANKLFYGEMLVDGVTETDRQPLVPFLPTVCLYSVERGQESCEGAGSYYNEEEAQFVVFLLQVLLSTGLEPASLGVITLYRSQMARITDLLTVDGDEASMRGVQVSTVDAFQGGEKEVIILSCVRTNNCGFINTDKRMNVALTRARHHLFIVGHCGNLSTSVLWSKVIDHCKAFENGVQSSEEARNTLETYLDTADCGTNDLQDSPSVQAGNSSNNKGRKQARKRKTVQDDSQSQSSSDTQSGKFTTAKRRKFSGPKQTRRGDAEGLSEPSCETPTVIEDGIVCVEPEDDYVEEHSQTPQSFTSSEDSSCAAVKKDKPVVDNRDTIPSRGKRNRYADKLEAVLLDSDNEASDIDLPVFSCGKVL